MLPPPEKPPEPDHKVQRQDVQTLLSRPRVGRKPETLELLNKEIHQRLKACRGQNRRQHPLLPSMALELPPAPASDARVVAIEDEGQEGQSGRHHTPSPGKASADSRGWRQRLRSRAWRMPRQRGPGDSPASMVHRGAVAQPQTSRVRDKDDKQGRARARRRLSTRRSSFEQLMGIMESGSTSRRTSGQRATPESKEKGGRRSSSGRRSSQANGPRRSSFQDRRHGRDDSDGEEADEEDDFATQSRPTSNQKQPLQAFVEVETKEVDLSFQVVKWSTQRPESPAADLEKQSGWWESANGSVENQFIVLQLSKAQKLLALELSLPGNESGPRCCKLQYSETGPDGPWKEAWQFQVASKADVKCRTTFETGNNVLKDFKDWLVRSYRGNVQEAWKLLFNENQVEIPCLDFLAAIGRIKQQFPSSNVPLWCQEAQKLSEDLDPTKSGKVTLAALLQPAPPPPEAPFWKLNILSNWGSAKRLQIMSPLRLTTTIQVQTGGLSRIRGTFIENQAGSLAGDSLIRAFDLETLGVDSEAVQLRRLAKKFGLSILDVEDMHRLFSNATSDGRVIVQSEFTSMLLKLYGTEDLSEVPPQRLRFFWQQADQDGSGEIDFEEFIMWYDRYSEEILSRRKTRRRRDSTDSDTRHDFQSVPRPKS